jgi:hypothetical protein
MNQLNSSPHPVISMPRVRIAELGELDEIMVLSREVHAENGLHDLDERKVIPAMTRALVGDGAFIGVIGPVGALEAMIYLGVNTFWYTSTPHLEEQVNYVRPEFRRTKNAAALIEYAKACSIQLGLPLLISVLSTSRTKEKIRLYRRRLGEPSGAYFLYNGKTGQ